MPDALLFCNLSCPSLITIRPPSIDASPQCFQLSFVEWCVDSIDPSGKPWQWPTCQELGKGFGRLIPSENRNRRAKAQLWKPGLLEADYAQRTDRERRNGHRLERESFCNAIGKCDHSRESGNARDTEANALR